MFLHAKVQQNIRQSVSRYNNVAAAMEIGGVTTASEFHYMQNLCCYAGWDWLPQRNKIEYHRWSVICWISHCLELESFPAEGYGTNFNTGELPCVFFWSAFETIDKDVSFTSRSMEYIGNNSHLFSGTERHSSLQELPSTATDHAQDAQWRTLRSRS
jgi:hypothetical protein